MARGADEIRRDILDQLRWDSRVSDRDIEVEVENGMVILKGSVPSWRERNIARTDVLTVLGVTVLQNDLRVRQPEGEKLDDEEIRAGIQNLLSWTPDLATADMEISVQSGNVTLRGTVTSYWKKVRAEEMAAQFGVSRIINELAVVPTESVSDKAIALDITAALERYPAVDIEMIDVKVEHGRVTLMGRIKNGKLWEAANDIACYTRGVVEVHNQLQIDAIQ